MEVSFISAITIKERWQLTKIQDSLNTDEHFFTQVLNVKVKVKPSRYTPWRRLGGEEV
jgi:hypothetical protein